MNRRGRVDLKDVVSLTQAAHELGVGYARARDLMLVGQLSGQLIRGRWFVSGESVTKTAARLYPDRQRTRPATGTSA